MSANTLEYEGDAGPDWLEADVVFRANRLMILLAGFGIGYCAWLFLMMLAALVASFATDWSLSHTVMRDIALVSIGLAAHASVVLWERLGGGLTMVVSAQGITVRRGEQLLQDCPWEKMTVLVTGRGWSQSISLADAKGQPFLRFGFVANLPEQRRAMLVIRTQARRLKVARDAAAALPPKSRWATWHFVAMVCLGVPCWPLFRFCVNAFITAAGDPASTLLERGALLLGILASAMGIGVGLLGVALGIAAFDKARSNGTPKYSGLRSLIADRTGQLDPVDMAEGVWYDYVDPTASGLAALKRGSEVRRSLGVRIRRAGDGYELSDPAGNIIPATLVNPPKPSPAASLSFGADALRLRGANGKFYRVDPRFIVPVREPDV